MIQQQATKQLQHRLLLITRLDNKENKENAMRIKPYRTYVVKIPRYSFHTVLY